MSEGVKLRKSLELIAAERERQIVKEKFSSDHDAGHSKGYLARAAACYAVEEPLLIGRELTVDGDPRLPVYMFQSAWPFCSYDYKPKKNRLKNLVRAAALLVAEIDKELDAENCNSIDGELTK